MAKTRKDFATLGTDSFTLDGQEKGKRVILNISDPDSEGIVLEKKKKRYVKKTGNALVDIYNVVNGFFIRRSKIKLDAKATFFHLLSVMINAGIPMVRALNSLSVQNKKNARLALVVSEMAEKVEGGLSLSKAMEEEGNVFNEQEMGMVKSGEASGQLAKILDNLAKDTSKAYSIRKKVKSAMIYPSIILVLLIAVIVVMMIFVVPKMTDLFSAAGAELPLVTRIVVGISDFFVNQKFVLGVIVVGASLGFLTFRKFYFGRKIIDRVKIGMPIFGALFKKAYLARFSRSFGNLLDSNISIVRALEIVANSIGNITYKEKLLLSVEDIKQGIPLAENLTESKLFPPMLVNMVDVGERTAQLDSILAKVANFYEDEVDTAVAGISKSIEPVILIVIGVVVGGIVAAIMLPIMKLTDLAGAL